MYLHVSDRHDVDRIRKTTYHLTHRSPLGNVEFGIFFCTFSSVFTNFASFFGGRFDKLFLGGGAFLKLCTGGSTH